MSMVKKITHLVFFFLIFGISEYGYSQNCTVNAGIDGTLCQNQVMTLNGNSQGLITVAAKWTQVGGPSTSITDPNELITNVTGYTSGIAYKFRITATCQDGQIVFDEVTNTVNPISTANAGPDQATCPGSGVLAANSAGSGETGAWTGSGTGSAGITVSQLTNPVSPFTLLNTAQGSTTLRWTITNGSCTSFDDVVVTNYGGQTPVSAGPDQILGNCYTSTQSTPLNASIGGNGAGGQIGTWSLVSGPNIPTFGNVNVRNTTVSNLIQGIYILRWSVTGPCVTGTDEMQITVPAATQAVTAANAGADIRYCNASTTAVLSGNAPQYANEVVTWTQTAPASPLSTIVTPNDPVTSVTGLDGTSSYTFRMTIQNSISGCSTSDNVQIFYSTPPSISITSGDQIRPCGTMNANVTYTNGSSTQYRIVNGPYTGNWTTAGNNNQTITFTQYGSYNVLFRRYQTGIECEDAYAQTVITISQSPTASNAGTDQILACNIIETDLAGNNPAAGTGKWSQVNGPTTAVYSDIYNRSSHISNLVEGEYFFRWLISGGSGCSTTQDDVRVVVSTPYTSTTAAGADQTICSNSVVYLDASPPADNETGTWTVVPSSGVIFSNIHDPDPTVTELVQGETYTFTWTVASACASATDVVVISIGTTAGPSIANAGPNQCNADGTVTSTLEGNSPTVGTGTWTILNGPNSPSITDIHDNNTTITSMINGNYEIEWAITNSGCQTTRDTVFITISPTASNAVAGPDITLCGTATNLAATNPAVGTGVWTQTSGAAGVVFSNINSSTANVSNLTSGAYVFNWQVAYGVCPATNDQVSVFVSTPPSTANAGPDQAVCSATSAVLAANTPTVGSGFWSVSGTGENNPTFSSVTNPAASITGLVTGQYQLQWNISSGPYCPASTDIVLISVSAPANAGSDRQLCDASSVLLTGTDGTTGTWTEVSALGSTITTTGDYTAIASNLVSAGDYTFRYTVPVVYACPSTFDDVLIQVSPFGSQPDAGVDKEICTGGGTSVAMTASSPGVGTATWSWVSGPNTPTFSLNTDPNTLVTGLIQGTYILKWQVTYNWCGNFSDIVRVNVYNPPTVANAGADQASACILTSQLLGNTPTSGVGAWTLLSGAGTVTIDNPGLPTTYLSNPSAAGLYTFEWRITNGTVCAASADQVDLTFASPNPPSTPDAGIDKSICDATSLLMTGNTIATGIGTWSQFSGPETTTIVSPNSPSSNITGLNTDGTYQFVWTSSEGSCSLSDNVSVLRSTTIPSTAGSDNSFCEFLPVNLNANLAAPGIGTWTQLSGPSTSLFANANQNNTVVNGTVFGDYVYQWNIVNGACSDASTVDISIIHEPLNTLTVSSVNDLCYASDATVTIHLSQNGFTYSAYIGSTLITTNTGNGGDLEFTIPQSSLLLGNNYITFTSDNGYCSSTLNNQALVEVIACTDLSITKTATPTTQYAGSNVVFTINVTNNGPSAATGVIVNDILPNGFTYISNTPSTGAYNSVSGVWTVGNLATSSSASLEITASVDASGNYVNVANVSGNEHDTDTDNNEDDVTITPVPVSDLSILKSVDNSTPDVLGNVVFTLTVTNNGPSDATGVMVTDILPDGYIYISDNGASAYDSGTGTWTIGNLANTNSVSLDITAQVKVSGDYLNNATVTGNETDSNLDNNDDDETVIPNPLADLSIDKTVNNATAEVGSNVVFTLIVTNNGPSNATGVIVTDNLPSGFIYVSDNSGGNYNSGTWTIGNLAIGNSVSIEITAFVYANGNYTNSATVTGNEDDPDINNNEDNVTVGEIPVCDIQLVKNVNLSTQNVGSNVVFSIQVTNNGPSDATNVSVTDALPDGYDFVSYTATVGTYDSGTGTWTIGNLNNTSVETLDITAMVKATGIYLNTASVSGDELDTNPDNNDDDANITPISTADLSVVKTVDNSTAYVGENVVFTLTVTNNGLSNATDVLITDILPNGYDYVSDNGLGAYDSGTGLWTVGNLDYLSTASLEITAMVTANGSYLNHATVTGDEEDLIPENNEDEITVTPTPSADLSILKSVDNSTQTVGSDVVFTLTVTNNGLSDATNVIVNDILPDGFTYLSDNSAGAYDNISGIWNVGNMAFGSSVSLNITATVKVSGNYTNSANVTAFEHDPVPENNSDDETVSPTPLSDLSIVKICDNMTPNVGSNLVFTLTVTNNGPSDAVNVSVNDLLPSGYDYLSDNGVGTYNSVSGVWNIGNLANGLSVSLEITATVKANGMYTNTAIVSGDITDPNPDDNTDDVTPEPIPISDLSLLKTVNLPNAVVGSNVIFTISVTNNGLSDATGVNVTDILPSGFDFISANPSIGSWLAPNWNIGNLAFGASESLEITASVKPSGIYINSASVSGNELDLNPDNNEDDAIVSPVPGADLSIVKSVDILTPLVTSNVIFTLTVTNNGLSDATNVTVSDILPTGFTFVSANPSVGTWNEPTWNIGNLAYLQSVSLQITALVNATGDYKNFANVTGDEADPNPDNNVDDITLDPIPLADLEMIKTVNNTGADVGTNVIFTLTVINNGPSDATGVTVSDLLPSGYTFVSDDSNENYNSATGIWTIGNLSNQESVSIQITASVNSAGNYINSAGVTGSEQDPNPDNNDDDAVVNPGAVSDLSIEKTVDNMIANIGTQIVFTLTATNNGPSDASGVSVTDQMPTGFTYITDNSAGAYDATTGVWTVGNLTNGTSVSIQITASVNSTGNYTNSAVITGNQPDPNSDNNNDEISVTADAVCDLSLIKSVNNTNAPVGSQVVFTLKVFNHGPSGATGVSMSDQLPSGYTYISDNSNGNYVVSTGIWTIGTLASGDSLSLEITVEVNATGDFLNTATVIGNEFDPTIDNNTDTESVTVDLTLFIPEGISPNNDGKNDTWVITGLEQYPDHKVIILNRWGNKIYEASPYLNNWDGTNMYGVSVDGEQLPEGTYFYIIETGKSGVKPIKGYIYLSK